MDHLAVAHRGWSGAPQSRVLRCVASIQTHDLVSDVLGHDQATSSPSTPKASIPGDNPPVTTAAPQPKIDIHDIAHRLWETADELRANSHLKAAEYSIPVLGLIFLKFADSRFTHAEAELAGSSTGRRHIGKANYQAQGVLYLPPQSRFANLLLLKEKQWPFP